MKRVALALALALGFVVTATARPARADEEDRDDRPLPNGAFVITVGAMTMNPKVGDSVFAGTGTPLERGAPQHFRATGRQIGLESSQMAAGELSFLYVRRYVSFGAMAFAGGRSWSAPTALAPPSGGTASVVSAGDLKMYGGGLDLAGAIPLGRAVTLRPGAVVGMRSFSVPLSGFQQTHCFLGKANSRCFDTADTAPALFAEPRIRIEIKPPALIGYLFGAYAGLETVNGSGFVFGLFVGGRTARGVLGI